MVEWILNPQKSVTKGMAVAILVINIVIPGVGTMIYGRILRGVVELLTSWLIVGWVFALIDGIQVLTKATSGTPALTPTT